MSNGTTPPTKIWIFRKGNGQVKVHPSPVLLARDQPFRIRNLTTDAVIVTFYGNEISQKETRIDPRGWSDPLVAVGPTGYFEYDVVAGGHYADGGSKPGGIIDP